MSKMKSDDNDLNVESRFPKRLKLSCLMERNIENIKKEIKAFLVEKILNNACGNDLDQCKINRLVFISGLVLELFEMRDDNYKKRKEILKFIETDLIPEWISFECLMNDLNDVNAKYMRSAHRNHCKMGSECLIYKVNAVNTNALLFVKEMNFTLKHLHLTLNHNNARSNDSSKLSMTRSRYVTSINIGDINDENYDDNSNVKHELRFGTSFFGWKIDMDELDDFVQSITDNKEREEKSNNDNLDDVRNGYIYILANKNKYAPIDESELERILKASCDLLEHTVNNETYNLSIKDIFALKLYTDCTEFCCYFRECFRNTTTDKYNKRLAFYTLAKHLYFLFKEKAIPLSNVLFHGITNDLFLQNMRKYYGPVSLTNDWSKMKQLIGENNTILHISSGHNTGMPLYGIQVDWLSSFGSEMETVIYDSWFPVKQTTDSFGVTDHGLKKNIRGS